MNNNIKRQITLEDDKTRNPEIDILERKLSLQNEPLSTATFEELWLEIENERKSAH